MRWEGGGVRVRVRAYVGGACVRACVWGGGCGLPPFNVPGVCVGEVYLCVCVCVCVRVRVRVRLRVGCHPSMSQVCALAR